MLSLLPQMREVMAEVEQHSHKWVCKDRWGKPQPTPPEKVNLYHVDENLITPSTTRHECSYVEMRATGPQTPLW